MFQIERDEWAYDTGKTFFSNFDEPIFFKDKADAEEQAKMWNTGVVVPYITKMSEDELKASIYRSERNGK